MPPVTGDWTASNPFKLARSAPLRKGPALSWEGRHSRSHGRRSGQGSQADIFGTTRGGGKGERIGSRISSSTQEDGSGKNLPATAFGDAPRRGVLDAGGGGRPSPNSDAAARLGGAAFAAFLGLREDRHPKGRLGAHWTGLAQAGRLGGSHETANPVP